MTSTSRSRASPRSSSARPLDRLLALSDRTIASCQDMNVPHDYARHATIGGTTRLIGIVGDPIAQVKSPHTWNPRLAAAGRDAVLIPLHIRVADFDETIEAVMRIANLDGLVFTLPFKERIIPHLASIT